MFAGSGKSVEICFFPLETKETIFFAEIFKFQGGTPPSNAHARAIVKLVIPYTLSA